jgi:hypothetical protein
MGKRNRTRTQRANREARRLQTLLQAANERERQRRLEEENYGVPFDVPNYRFFNYYGKPENLRPAHLRVGMNYMAALRPQQANMYRRGSSENQKRQLVFHRERYLPTLRSIYPVVKSKRQLNTTRKRKAAVVEELKYLPPIQEMGYPGGNEYRAAEERWKSLANYT